MEFAAPGAASSCCKHGLSASAKHSLLVPGLCSCQVIQGLFQEAAVSVWTRCPCLLKDCPVTADYSCRVPTGHWPVYSVVLVSTMFALLVLLCASVVVSYFDTLLSCDNATGKACGKRVAYMQQSAVVTHSLLQHLHMQWSQTECTLKAPPLVMVFTIKLVLHVKKGIWLASCHDTEQ